jgi:hypothetical protein
MESEQNAAAIVAHLVEQGFLSPELEEPHVKI